MNKKQTQAMVSLAANAVAWAIFAFSAVVLYLSNLMSSFYIVACAGCILWVGVMWFLPFSSWVRARSKYKTDERELMIIRQSLLAGYISIWFYVIAAMVALGFIVGPQATVAVGFLPAFVYIGMGIFSVVCNATAFCLYRDGKGEQQ